MPTPAIQTQPDDDVLRRLLDCHRDFLRFLESRLPDRTTAEEILQEAFARSLDRGGSIRDPERSVAWFYRLLRNALVDHYRRRASEARALQQTQSELVMPSDSELEGVICSCLQGLLPTLHDDYQAILQRVDFDDAPLDAVAVELGITRNNAGVRLHRARQALKKALERSCGTCAEHGCLDCSCGHSASCSAAGAAG